MVFDEVLLFVSSKNELLDCYWMVVQECTAFGMWALIWFIAKKKFNAIFILRMPDFLSVCINDFAYQRLNAAGKRAVQYTSRSFISTAVPRWLDFGWQVMLYVPRQICRSLSQLFCYAYYRTLPSCGRHNS